MGRLSSSVLGSPYHSCPPINYAVSETRFSVMKNEKSEIMFKEHYVYQSRLNHVLMLNIYTEKFVNIDITQTATEFVKNSEHCQRIWKLLV